MKLVISPRLALPPCAASLGKIRWPRLGSIAMQSPVVSRPVNRSARVSASEAPTWATRRVVHGVDVHPLMVLLACISASARDMHVRATCRSPSV